MNTFTHNLFLWIHSFLSSFSFFFLPLLFFLLSFFVFSFLSSLPALPDHIDHRPWATRVFGFFLLSLSLSISKRLSPQSASPHARIRGSACYSFFFPESNRRHRCGFLFPISPSFLSSWTLSLTISVFFFFHIMLFRRLPLYRAHWLIQFDWIMPFSLSWLSVTILPQWTSIATGTLWQWRSPRARFPQDGPTSDLRKVSGLTSLYTETDQQYLSQVGSPGCLL